MLKEISPMFCTECKTPIGECTCPDIDDRLAQLSEDRHLVYRRCRDCKKHYARCRCANPQWESSIEGVELPATVH